MGLGTTVEHSVQWEVYQQPRSPWLPLKKDDKWVPSITRFRFTWNFARLALVMALSLAIISPFFPTIPHSLPLLPHYLPLSPPTLYPNGDAYPQKLPLYCYLHAVDSHNLRRSLIKRGEDHLTHATTVEPKKVWHCVSCICKCPPPPPIHPFIYHSFVYQKMLERPETILPDWADHSRYVGVGRVRVGCVEGMRSSIRCVVG